MHSGHWKFEWSWNTHQITNKVWKKKPEKIRAQRDLSPWPSSIAPVFMEVTDGFQSRWSPVLFFLGFSPVAKLENSLWWSFSHPSTTAVQIWIIHVYFTPFHSSGEDMNSINWPRCQLLKLENLLWWSFLTFFWSFC